MKLAWSRKTIDALAFAANTLKSIELDSSNDPNRATGVASDTSNALHLNKGDLINLNSARSNSFGNVFA